MFHVKSKYEIYNGIEYFLLKMYCSIKGQYSITSNYTRKKCMFLNYQNRW